MKQNISRASRRYLLNRGETRLNLVMASGISGLTSYCMTLDFMSVRGMDFQLLISYAMLVGLVLIIGNAMIVDLTVKDKLSRRIEFFMGSGLEIGDVIYGYTMEMYRIAGVIPLAIVILNYMTLNWTIAPQVFMLFVVSSFALVYGVLLMMNTVIMRVQRLKLLKNMTFFFSFLFIYALSMISSSLLDFLQKSHLSLVATLIVINVLTSGMLILFASKKIKGLTHEDVIRRTAKWE